MENREIRIRISSVDGFSKSAKFKTIDGARRFAHKYVGAHPEIGMGYAVEGYSGTTKATWQGTTADELFPPPA